MSAHRATETRIPSRASLCEVTLEIIGQGLRARYELPWEQPLELRRLVSSLNLRLRRSRKPGRSAAILFADDEAHPHCNRIRPALVQKELDPEQNPKTVLSSVGVARYNSIDFPHLHRGAAAALDNAHRPVGQARFLFSKQ